MCVSRSVVRFRIRTGRIRKLLGLPVPAPKAQKTVIKQNEKSSFVKFNYFKLTKNNCSSPE
jgi:hypothetical protein